MWVILLLCVPLIFDFWFQSILFDSNISFLNCTCFVPKLLASVATSVIFLSKPNNHCTTCYKREGQRQRNGEEEPKRWGANNELKFTENLYKKNISIQTSEQDVSKSLISIFTFIKELYNSIHSQVPAPMSHGCLVQEKLNERMNQGSRGVGGLV